ATHRGGARGRGPPPPKVRGDPADPHHGAAHHPGRGNADSVLTAGPAELRPTQLAARLGGDARPGRSHPGPAFRLDLSPLDPVAGSSLGGRVSGGWLTASRPMRAGTAPHPRGPAGASPRMSICVPRVT